MASGPEVAKHYGHQSSVLGTVIHEHEAFAKGQLAQAADQIANQRALAARELAAIYVPALTDEVFERAGQLTGFQGFKRRDPRQAMAQERKVLTSSLAQLDADERYQRRETLLGPDGTLQQELDTAKEALAPLQTECERFETLQDFLELVQVGYDTPSFTEHWWNAAYWKHWAAGDRICKQLGMADFGDDVLPAYRRYSEPRDVLAADVARVGKQIADAHAVVQKRDETATRLSQLDDIYLVSAQDFLAEHLALADHALLEQWVGGQPEERAVQQALRKLAGVTAKQQIIDEIATQGVPQLIGDLRQRRQKAMEKSSKFNRPKYSYAAVPNQNINPQFDSKMAALQANQQKMSRRIDDLVAFDDYSRFNLRNDSQLWWWYFFNSSPNRYYTPGLYSYYERRPDIAVMEDDVGLGDLAVQAAIGDSLERSDGYLS
ncbi:MAG TPA: hypothetical protein VGC41_07700 [Kofleriaceae bacterium]